MKKNYLLSFLLIVIINLSSSTLFGQTASFTATLDGNCSPINVSFTDTSTGGATVTSWLWDFGNSNTSTVQNPSANYPKPGIYTVTLTINGGGSAELISTQTIEVYPSPAPIIPSIVGCGNYTGDLTISATPIVVAPFIIGSSTVGGITGGSVTSYTFNFLGALPTVGPQASPTISLTNVPVGSYDLLLTVADVNGCSTTIFKQAAIIVNPIPTANFTFVKESVCGPGNVTFSGASAISSGSVIDYLWEIDGTPVSTDQNFTYNFTAFGDYDVTFKAISDNLCESIPVTKTVSFNAGSTPDFGFSGNCLDIPVAFTDASSADAVSWVWDFGNGNTSTSQNPSNAYTSPGDYNVTLTTTFSDGCVLSTTKPITIIGATPSFTYTATNACAPDYTINFTNTSTVSGTTITGYAWDFNNDSITDSTIETPSYNFGAAGFFPVSLEVTTADGCTNTLNSSVSITPTVVDFSAVNTTGCATLATSFSTIYNNASDPITSYSWDFGDGNSSNLPAPTHNYTVAGDYTVTLNVTTTNGCTLTSTKPAYVLVGDKQPITFVSDLPNYCFENNSVELTATITNLTTEVLWDYGDGDTSTEYVTNATVNSVSHSYSDPGVYNISATTIYNGCESDAYQITVTILEPRAIFVADSYSECSVPTNTITFTNNSIIDNITPVYAWDFGDGTTSALKNPTHIYAATGDYTVTLTVTDSGSAACSDTTTSTIYVTTFDPVFTVSDTNPICAGSTFTFTNQLATNSSANFSAASYAWDFGDGGTSTAANPTYTYPTPGIYTASLTVTEEHGCVKTYTYPADIVVNGPIILDFTTNVSEICPGGDVTFTPTVTKRGGLPSDPSTSYTYEWDFENDGTIDSTIETPTNIFAAVGDYTVTLTVTDNLGCSATESKTASVRVPALTAGIATTRNIYCLGNVTFTSSSTLSFGTIDLYEWDLDNDGSYEISGPSSSQTIDFSSQGTGIKTVGLRVTNNLGCSDTTTKSITIVDDAVDIIIANVNLGCAPSQGAFSTTDPTGAVSSYLWNFGDGTTSNQQNPFHYYLKPGTYTVTLTETLTGGCTKSDTILVYVDGPIGVFTYDDTPGCAPHEVTFLVENLEGADALIWDFGDGTTESSPIANGVTSATTTHTYTSYGSRLPILILHSTTCGNYSYLYGINRRINTTEKPIPEFSFTTKSANENCQGSNIQFTDLSTRVDPRYPISSWQWDFETDGTIDSTEKNPTHAYLTEGIYTATLYVGNGIVPGGCDATISKIITVNPLPDAAITPSSQTICNGTSTNDMILTINNSIVSTFVWSRDEPAGITSGTAISGVGTTITGGVFNNSTPNPITVTYTITPTGPAPTFCEGDPVTATIVVNPTSLVSSAPTQTICNNTNLNYDIESLTAGTTFTWVAALTSGSVTGFNSDATGTNTYINDVLVNSGITPGVVTYTITPTGPAPTNCPGTPFDLVVTVNPTPDAIASSSTEVICSGATPSISFSTNITGTTVNYSWTAALQSGTVTGFSTGSGSTLNQPLVNNGPIQGVVRYTITPSIGGCDGAAITVDITVNPAEQVDSISNQVVCNLDNSTFIAFSTTNTDGTTTYNWANTNTSIGLPASGSGAINFVSDNATNAGNAPISGTITVTPTYTNGGVSCTGNPKTFTITVNPTGKVNAPGNKIFCNSTLSTVNFTTPNTGGTVTYAWTNTNTAIGLGGSGTGNLSFTTTNTTTAPISGDVTVTPTFTNGGVSCQGNSETFTITVNPTGQVNDPADQVVCNSATTTLITFATTNTGGTTTYSWVNNRTSIGLAGSGSGGTIPSFTAVNTGTAPVTATITVTPTYTNSSGGGSCTGTPETFTIRVNPTPKVNSAAAKTICDNTSVGYNITSATASTTFTWTVSQTTAPTGGSITGFSNASGASINQVLQNTGTTPGAVTYTITPTGPATTNCPGTPFNLVVTVNPDPVPAATVAETTFCSGGTTDIVLSSTAPSVTYYYAAPTLSGGAGSITGFSSRTSPGNTAKITDKLINTTATIQTATYTVYAIYNGCVSSTPAVVVITVDPIPVLTDNLTQELCIDNSNTAVANLTLTTTPSMTGALFTYSAPTLTGGMTGGSARTVATSDPITDTFVNTTNTAQTATYIVTPIAPAGLGGCDTGIAKNVIIKVYPRSRITSALTAVVCSNSLYTYTATSNVANSTFTWSRALVAGISNVVGSGTSASISETLINTTTAPIDVTYVLTPTGPAPTSCIGTPSSLVVTVNPRGQVNDPGDQELCYSDATSLITFGTNNTGGTTTYSWVNNTTSIGLAASGSGGTIPSFTAVNTGTAPVTATITVTPTYSNGGESCTGTPVDFTITVNPTPTVNSATTKTICDNTSVGYNITSATTGTTFTWTVSETTAPAGGSITGFNPNATGTNTAIDINDILVNSGTSPGEVTYTITPTGPTTTDCPGTPFNLVVIVNPDPIPLATPDVESFCSGGTTSIALSSSITVPGVTYYYDAPVISGVAGSITGFSLRTSPGNIDPITDTLLNTTAEIQTATYTIYAVYGGCVSSTPEVVVITVDPVPVLTTGLTEELCVDDSNTTAESNLLLTTDPDMAGALFSYPAPTLSDPGLTIVGGATERAIPSVDPIQNTFVNTTNTVQTATYSVTPIAPGILGACEPGTPTDVVITVYPRSRINSPLTDAACSNYLFSYTITSNVASSTFTWSRAAVIGISNSSGSGNSNLIEETLVNTTASAINVAYILTPTGPTGCAGTPSTLVVSVNPTPAVTAGLTQAICSGTAANLSITSTPAVSATTYTWPAPTTEGSAGTISGGTARTVGSLSPITDVLVNNTNAPLTLVYLVTPTSPSGCVGATTEVKITVNPIPIVTSVSTKDVCANSSVAYSPTSNVSGATYTWTASLTSGTVTGINASGSGATINDVLVNATNTTGVVRYVITPKGPYSTNCVGTPFNLDVTVNPTPDAIATPIAETICSGGTTSIDLSTNTTGATVSYSWTAAVTSGSASGFSVGSGTTISETLFNSTTSPATVRYKITPSIGTCTGSPINVDITVNSGPNFTYITNQGLCSSILGSVDFNNLPSGNWTINQSGTSTDSYAGSGASYIVPSLASGTYNFSVTNSAGCTSALTPNIVINNVICANDDDYSASPVNETTGGIVSGSNVFNNDLLNNLVLTPADVTLSSVPTGPLTVNSDGSVTVDPNTTPGTYFINYTICEDANPTNCDTGTVTVVVIETAELKLTKTVSAGPYNVGENVTFTITVTNNGPSDATNIDVTDQLPSGYSFVSASTANGTYDETTGAWTVGSLTNSSVATLTVVATINATGNYTNIAEVTDADQRDPNGVVHGNYTSGEIDQDNATILEVPISNLVTTKTVDRSNPNLGDMITYVITVVNNGPSNATGVSLTDILPIGINYSTHVAYGGTLNTYDAVTGIWNIGTLNNNTSATLIVDSTVAVAGTVAQTAIVNSTTAAIGNETDPTNAGNDLDASITVTSTDLVTTKTVDNATPNEGDTIVYTVTVTNNGPSDATGISLTDLLPAGVTYVSDDAAGAYNHGSGLWSVGIETELVNGSFESGDFTGWTAIDNPNPFLAYGVYASNNGLGNFSEALPSEGGFLAGNGFDGDTGEAILYQDIAVSGTTTLSWDENIDYDLTFGASIDRIYEVQVRDLSNNVLEVLRQVTAVSGNTENDNVWNSFTANLSAYSGQTIRIAFWQNIPENSTGPAKFALDNVVLSTTSNTLASGDSVTLNITATVDAGTSGQTITNSTTAARGNQSDPTIVNDDLTEAIIVNGPPVALNDSSTGNTTNTAVTVAVLNNDNDSDGTLEPSTVQIVGTAGAGVSLVVSGEGTWSINSSTGAITFTPITGFTSNPTPIFYTVSDNDGNVSNQATVTITYTAIAPVALADLSSANTPDTAVTVNVVSNDSDSDGSIDATTVSLVIPIGATSVVIDSHGDVTSFVVPGEGTWSVNLTTGAITFTPLPTFDDDPTPVLYNIEDNDGNVSNNVAVTIDYVPVATNDVSLGNV
ncbi:PKD-like domain-containing protein, partial [Lutibacter sp.]|uniref:PKD-like domain-containing protein n=1 Tax=Lutibacter sp. TaxID=1925666 RepID=UPI001A34B5B0